MIDAPTYVRLQNLIRRESRTFLQYAAESFPWTKLADEEGVRTLQAVASAETEAVAEVGKFLRSQHLTPPGLGAYPSQFTRFNFLGMDRLLPIILKELRDGIAALETDLRQVKEPAARQQFASFLALKQQNLKTLEMLGTPPETKVVA